jgi:arabinofuranosyltransferase
MQAKTLRDPFVRLFIAATLAFGVLLLANAWVVDDAYITMRTVDNWVHGFGLTWNTSERVQAYTHPLWMLILAGLYFVTRESFFTIVAASFVTSLSAAMVSAAFVTRGWRAETWKAPLVLLAFTACKAVIDYTSSGLENALSYLIAALFLRSLSTLDREEASSVPMQPFFWASLAYLCRPDSVLLYVPALLYVLARRPQSWRGAAGRIVIATLPATLWTLFSIVYYGFPFPNTAYAKSFVSGIPLDWKVERGIEYLANSLRWDGAAYGMAIAAGILAVRRRSKPAMAVMAGVVLYIAGVVVNFASATHMSGRLLALALFISIVMFVRLLEGRGYGAGIAAALVAFVAWSPVSAPKLGTGYYRAYPQNENYIDTKWYVYNEGAALLHWRPGLRMPDHDWYRAGEAMRASPQRVFVGGPAGVAIGYAGFAAGPDKFIIDRVGLSDPLLARLPAYTPTRRMLFKSGHFQRFIPEGYVESVERDIDAIANPGLAKYYAAIRNITRGPLFRADRFRDIVNMNLGRYDGWLAHPASPGDIPAAPR